MIVLSWLLGIVGVLGVAGAAAAFIFFPLVAVPVLQRVVEWLLGCKKCLYALAIVAVAFAAFWGGHHRAVLDCRADALAAQLAAKQADLDHAKKSAADEAKRANTIEASANDQKSKDAAYIAALESRPACALDDADISGLPNKRKSAPGKKPAPSAK
jgi:hypothetical protein